MPLKRAKLSIIPQPTETSCGPTCLKAIYDHYGLDIPLPQLIQEIASLEEGGTLMCTLANHALRRGFSTTIYTYNLEVFDPTWFPAHSETIIEKLKLRKQIKSKKKLQYACQNYIEYFTLGGKMKMEDLNPGLIRSYLKEGMPILTGLSSTYLYREKRALFNGQNHTPDDVAGNPDGHFVIMESYNPDNKMVSVLDPYSMNPYSAKLQYELPLDRLINAILLGIITYDANLLIIKN